MTKPSLKREIMNSQCEFVSNGAGVNYSIPLGQCAPLLGVCSSVAEAEPPGAATFRAAPELEPIFSLVGAGSRSRFF